MTSSIFDKEIIIVIGGHQVIVEAQDGFYDVFIDGEFNSEVNGPVEFSDMLYTLEKLVKEHKDSLNNK